MLMVNILVGNPISHCGLEKERRYNQKLVILLSICSKKADGKCVRMHRVVRHEHHRKRMRSGVNMKFAIGLMIEMGRPHAISIGSDMSDIANCSSKNDMQ